MTASLAHADLPRANPDSATNGTWAVVPVKALREAKLRLQDCLGEHREGFARAMLEDVLTALAASRRVSRVACVTADPVIASLAQRHGAVVVDERQPLGMNEAIGLGVEVARARGAQRIVVLPADLPLATGAEIDRLIAALEEDGATEEGDLVGLSPAAHSRGTNFLSLGGSKPFELRFGPDSFVAHQHSAEAGGFRARLLPSETLSFDIDTEKDLRHLVSYCLSHPRYQSGQTWKFLCRAGLADASEQAN